MNANLKLTLFNPIQIKTSKIDFLRLRLHLQHLGDPLIQGDIQYIYLIFSTEQLRIKGLGQGTSSSHQTWMLSFVSFLLHEVLIKVSVAKPMYDPNLNLCNFSNKGFVYLLFFTMKQQICRSSFTGKLKSEFYFTSQGTPSDSAEVVLLFQPRP